MLRAMATNAIAAPQNRISFGTAGLAKPRYPCQREECPCSDGDHVEDPDEIVDRGVVGASLVSVVQPVTPRQEDPQRERANEHQRLEERAEAVVAWLDVRPEHQLREQEGEQQARDIGCRQRPLDQPAASPCSPEPAVA